MLDDNFSIYEKFTRLYELIEPRSRSRLGKHTGEQVNSSLVQQICALVSNPQWILAAIIEVGVDIVLSHLHEVLTVAPNSRAVRATVAMVAGQAYYLRPPRLIRTSSYIAQQLCFQALAMSEFDLLKELETLLRSQAYDYWHPTCTTNVSSISLDNEWRSAERISAIAALPGNELAIAVGNSLFTWQLELFSATPTEVGHHEGVHAACTTPDGHLITAGSRTICIWDRGQVAATEVGGHAGAHAVEALSDDQIVSVGAHATFIDRAGVSAADSPIRLWTTDGSSWTAAVVGFQANAHALAVLDESRFITGASGIFCDDRILVWDITNNRDFPTELGRDEWVEAAVVLPDKRLVTAGRHAVTDGLAIRFYGEGSRLAIWDTDRPGAESIELGRHDGVSALAVLSDGRIVSASSGGVRGDSRVLLWNPDEPMSNPVELGRHDVVSHIAVMQDGRVVTAGPHSVRIWRVNDAQATRIRTQPRSISSLCLIPDGRIVSAGWSTTGSDELLVWTRLGAEFRVSELGQKAALRRQGTIVSLGKGRIATIAPSLKYDIGEERLLVWELDTPGTSPTEVGTHSLVETLHVLRNGEILTSHGRNAFCAGELLRWNPVQIGAGPDDEGQIAAVSITELPDGSIAVGTADGDIYLLPPLDSVSVDSVTQVGQHIGLTSIIASPDGRLVSAGGYSDGDHRVLLWDPANPGAQPTELGPSMNSPSLAVLPDGTVVVAGCWADSIELWDSVNCQLIHQIGCDVTCIAVGVSGSGSDLLVVANETDLTVWSRSR